jgi:hypothetical protein
MAVHTCWGIHTSSFKFVTVGYFVKHISGCNLCFKGHFYLCVLKQFCNCADVVSEYLNINHFCFCVSFMLFLMNYIYLLFVTCIRLIFGVFVVVLCSLFLFVLFCVIYK